ncbi:MAG: DUF3098 domain-containing protein [Crocinitomicaceae bacterium]|jgi:hypothetical protein|nr:DUF3098 domain-containing protein [Crocinitomicaceae bacterium]MCF8409883.1 DUF3098 domain-containing protein [Crocinitomicaceae bacterium]MCF8443547.1 DUF3098 domain-containing protein [Crocinitomicaceae bacterium]
MKFNHFGFQKENYRLLLIGIVINVVGFILMIGGGTDNPNNFNADELFSPIRITVSPMLIIAGYIVILYAIMKKPTKSDDESITETKK